MASNTRLCTICQKRNISRIATDWCRECNGGLCLDCKQIHYLSPASENHATIPVSESIGTLEPIEIRCELHGYKYQQFCRSHDQMACLICLEDHSSCKDIVSLSQIVGGVKESELYQDAKTGLSNIFDNISTVEKVLKDNYEIIEGDRNRLKEEVKRLCDQAVDRIRKIQFRIEMEINEKSEAAKSNELESTSLLEKKKSEVTELKLHLNNTEKFGSDIQMFVMLREIVKKTHENNEYLRALKDTGTTDKVKLSFTACDSLDGILKMDKLGTINIKHISTSIKLKQSKDKQAQFVQQRIQPRSFDDIKLSHVTSLKFQCSCPTGVCVLPNGNILMCDFGFGIEKAIVVVDETGMIVSTVPVPGKSVFDVAVIDENTVAVTSGTGNTVSIVDIPSSTIKRSITTEDYCHGITYHNNHLYCCVTEVGIVMISVRTGETYAFYKSESSSWSYITYHNNKLYLTDDIKHSVTCFDMDGCQMWTFGDSSIFKDPRAIAVCKFGNCFIADRLANNLVMLSENGTKTKNILTTKDGLNIPKVAFYDSERDRLLVCHENGEVFIYNFV